MIRAVVSKEEWSVGDSVRWYRQRKRWNQTQLAEKAGVSLKTVSRLENNENFERDTLASVADALNVSVAELQGFTPALGSVAAVNWKRAAPSKPELEADRLDYDTYRGYKPSSIPVIAEGEASPQGALFWNAEEGKPLIEADEWLSRPGDVTDPRAYAIKVRGDSMVPAYYPGMRLIVTPNTPVKNGARVYVELHSGERLVKVARRQKNGWILESLNPAYEPRLVTDDEVGTMHKIAYAREL